MVLCIANNWCIGKNNDLLFNIPLDMEIFKLLTSGSTIVMGRKTYDSLPVILKNRRYIVLSRNKDFTLKEGIEGDIMTLGEFKTKTISGDVYVIGGAEIYNELGPDASEIYLTRTTNDVDGDAYVNESILTGAKMVSKSRLLNEGEISFRFEKWVRDE